MDNSQPLFSIILPVIRQKEVNGWFATTQNNNFETELVNGIQAWLGPSYNKICEFVTHDLNDNRVAALRSQFNGPVLRFFGKDKSSITQKINSYYYLISVRPNLKRNRKRTVGEIRSDLEKALLNLLPLY